MINEENIHNVRVAFINDISEMKFDGEDEYDSVAFMLSPPFVFPEDLD